MEREIPEIEPGQLKRYLPKLLFWHAVIWKLPLIFSVVLTVVSMQLENPFLAVSFTSG